MNILDEDISAPECARLRAYKIHFRQIGIEVGRLGMKDREDILPLLHHLKRPTFFTLDHGFYHPSLLHQGFCLVFLDIWADEVADYVHRLLRHAIFRTQSQRMGKIIRIPHSGVSYWQLHQRAEQSLQW